MDGVERKSIGVIRGEIRGINSCTSMVSMTYDSVNYQRTVAKGR